MVRLKLQIYVRMVKDGVRLDDMKLNIFDSHTHSDNSPDGNHSVSYLCEKAIEKGIMGFAVTDHFECDLVEEGQATRLRQSAFETELARATFGSSVRIAKGIELAQPQMFPDVAQSILSEISFDVVLGSVHSLEAGKDLFYVDFNDPGVVVTDILEGYYQANLDLAQWNGFDSMAHLGYAERYIWGKYRIPFRYERYMDLIDETLRTLIHNGKALEVNTSGYRYGLGHSTPDRAVLARYRQLGGELITLGSDAHLAQDIGADFNVAMDLLLDLGYEYFAFYKDRKPVMLKLL